MRLRVMLAVVVLASLAPPAWGAEGGPIDLTVTVAGVPAMTAPGPDVDAGDPVVISYQVRNTTTGWMWSTYLYQEGVGRVTCPERHLAPRASMVCETSVTAIAGAFARAASVTAWPDSGGVEDIETVFYSGVVASTPSPFDNLARGRAATQASSPQSQLAASPALAVDGNRDGDHNAGSVAITYRVTDAWWEVDLGAVRAIDHVVLWNRTDCCVERLRRFHVFVSDAPFAVRDIKGTVDQVGVFDRFHEGVAGRQTEISVGRSGRYVRIQIDEVDAVLQLAEVEVMGTASAPPPPPPTAPTMAVEASVNGDVADQAPGPLLTAGDVARFTYRVTNTGTVELWALYLWHEGLGRIDCPDRRVRVGATVECVREVTAAAGAHTDLVTAQAWAGDGSEASASDPVHYSAAVNGQVSGPAISLEAMVDGDPADDAPGPAKVFGASLAFTYIVENVGTEELWALYIDHVPGVACPERHLLPGDTVECTGTGSARAGATVADVAASAWSGTGTRASAVDVLAYHTSVNASQRSIDLTATVNGSPAGTAPGPVAPLGSTVTLGFRVSNTGGANLFGLWVNAPGLGVATCPDRQLTPGETVNCTLSVPASAGAYSILARTVAYDDAGGEVEDAAALYYFVPNGAGASVKLEFLVDGLNGDVAAGPRIAVNQVMTFTYIASNTGAVPLSGVAVRDNSVGAISCPANTIAPGATLVCTRRLTAALTETSILATITTAQGISDTERLYYHVRPYGREDELNLEVTINGVDADAASGPMLPVGSTATIRYILTNNANNANMWNAQILDPKVPASAIRCTGGPSLGPTQSMVCTATIRIEAGQWSNQVVGQAWSSNGPRLDASDRVHYYGMP